LTKYKASLATKKEVIYWIQLPVQESAEDPVRNQSINSLFALKIPKNKQKESSRDEPILTLPSKLQPFNCSSQFFPVQEHTYQTRRGRILTVAILK